MELDVSFIACQQCHGLGYNYIPEGDLTICSICRAQASVIGFIENDLIYWQAPINQATLRANTLSDWINKSINFGLIIFAVGGLVALLLEFTASDTTIGIDLLFRQSSNLLIFWCSVLADSVLYYRINYHLERQVVIKPLNKLAHFVIKGEVTNWEYWRTVPENKKINIASYVERSGLEALYQSYTLANSFKHQEIKPIHLLLALREYPALQLLFYRLEINHQTLGETLERVAHHSQTVKSVTTNAKVSAALQEALLLAYAEARKYHRPQISLIELLIGVVLVDETIQDVLYDYNVDLTKIKNLVHWSNVVEEMMHGERRRRQLARGKPKTIMNRAMTARPTEQLDAISQDFTLLAKQNAFMPVIGRDKELAEAFRVLQEGFSSVLLVGESGAGKSSLLQGIANLMTAEDVPGPLQDKRLVVTDPGSIIASAGATGNLEQQMELIIQEIILAGNIIWGIEDIHTLLGAGSTHSSIDLGKILMNYISQGYLKVIGTATTSEFQKYIEHQETFLRRFQVVKISELSAAAAIQVLEGRSPHLEQRYNVFFTYDALEACVQLSERFISDRHLPSKALDIMEETAIYAQEQNINSKQRALVTRNTVAKIMAEKTNVALSAVSENEAEKLLQLEQILHQRVIGQDEAIIAIARALRRARQDIRDPHRPIASLLFLGPTGVGKTETAKAIAAVYFGNEENMIRLDMSEYQTKTSINRLIGSVGQEGYLTEAVRRTPFAIVLLDELEKAQLDLLNLFLQVMDDGRLTDGLGRVANFSNTMIIATSNAATDFIQQQYQQHQSSETIKDQILNNGILQQVFRTEFLNRFDHIAVFTPLNHQELTQVCTLMLEQLAKQLATRGINLRWQPTVVDALAARGYQPQFGARPLRRYLQDTIEDAIAKLLLRKELGRRDSVELQPNGEVKVIKAKSF